MTPSDPVKKNQPLPTGEAEEIVGRVRATVLATAEHRLRRRRLRVRVGVSLVGALALFTGGIAVGGAASALGSDDDNAIVTISCYPTVDAAKPDLRSGYADPTSAASARTAPVAVCEQGRQFASGNSVVIAEAMKLHAQGYACGTIGTTDGRTWSFVADTNSQNGSLGLTSGAPVTPLGSDCAHETGLVIPQESGPPSVACTVDDKNIAVYPLEGRTAKEVCAAKGLTAINP